jgi:hypothetical protein
MRDLVRARLDAVHALCRARQQLSGFLLRHGCHYRRPAWTRLHRRWLAGLKFEQTAHHIVLEDYIAACRAAWSRRFSSTAWRRLDSLLGFNLSLFLSGDIPDLRNAWTIFSQKRSIASRTAGSRTSR